MKTCSKAPLALFGMALLVAATGSRAGEIDGNVRFLVSPVSLSVSGSQPVATYTVTLTNTSVSNTINNGRLVATTTVAGGASDAQAVFKSVNGATCTVVNPERTRVDCSVGALPVGQAKSFTLTFLSPTSGKSIDLAWDAVFDSGTPPGGSNGNSDITSIVLEGISTNQVKSAVPAGGDTLSVFTGNFAVPSSTDQFTTSVTVPPVASDATASVVESPLVAAEETTTCKAQGNFRACYGSTISVKKIDTDAAYAYGDGNYLTFFLRVDKSNLRGGARLDAVVIRYVADDGTIESNVNFCRPDGNVPSNPIPDDDGTPCIAQASDFTRRKATQGWFGFQWILISLKNGRISVY